MPIKPMTKDLGSKSTVCSTAGVYEEPATDRDKTVNKTKRIETSIGSEPTPNDDNNTIQHCLPKSKGVYRLHDENKTSLEKDAAAAAAADDDDESISSKTNSVSILSFNQCSKIEYLENLMELFNYILNIT